MNDTEVECRHTGEQVLTFEVSDDELEAAAATQEKVGGFTHIGCTSLPDCPG
ncbi:MAG: hypothetical protein ACLPWG_14120 [Steroidobacteraceae bacterium]|jgi:hypothetical protein